MGPESSSPTPYPPPPRTPAGSCRRRRVVPRHRRERSVDRPLADAQRHGGEAQRCPTTYHPRMNRQCKRASRALRYLLLMAPTVIAAPPLALKAPSSRRGDVPHLLKLT